MICIKSCNADFCLKPPPKSMIYPRNVYKPHPKSSFEGFSRPVSHPKYPERKKFLLTTSKTSIFMSKDFQTEVPLICFRGD